MLESEKGKNLLHMGEEEVSLDRDRFQKLQPFFEPISWEEHDVIVGFQGVENELQLIDQVGICLSLGKVKGVGKPELWYFY